ncbi:MAG: ABC transporter permease subunit, partial [Anaerolineaceae bacterium]
MTEPKKKNEFLYFASRNPKLIFGFMVIVLFLLLTIIGPSYVRSNPFEYVNPLGPEAPSSEYLFGTTIFGQDVFAQFVHGLKATFLVGLIGGGIGTIIGILLGFTAGYRGGWVDEVINALTNVILVIPTFAVLLIISAYLEVRSIFTQSLLIGITAWPWAARA